MNSMTIIWLVALIVLAVLEGITVQLVSIWFAIGAAAACVTSLITDNIFIQIAVFIAVSAIVLAATRPLVKKFVSSRTVATNADRNIGRTAIVTERIDNLASTGSVKLDGVEWTARSLDDERTIGEGEQVVVREIRGVRLIVETKTENQ